MQSLVFILLTLHSFLCLLAMKNTLMSKAQHFFISSNWITESSVLDSYWLLPSSHFCKFCWAKEEQYKGQRRLRAESANLFHSPLLSVRVHRKRVGLVVSSTSQQCMSSLLQWVPGKLLQQQTTAVDSIRFCNRIPRITFCLVAENKTFPYEYCLKPLGRQREQLQRVHKR